MRDVHLGEVANTSDLNIFRSLDEVSTLDGPLGNGAGTTAILCAPSDGVTLPLTDGTRSSGRVEAEIGEGATERSII